MVAVGQKPAIDAAITSLRVSPSLSLVLCQSHHTNPPEPVNNVATPRQSVSTSLENLSKFAQQVGHIHPAYSLLEPVAMDSDNSVVVVKVENPFKRKLEDISGVVDSIADNWLCPITLELPIDPVMAEDGKIYERSAIEQWLREKRTSPSTNNTMGHRLFPAPQAKSTIEALVKSGAVSDDKVKAWKAKLEYEKKVKKWREAAQGLSLIHI